MTERFQVLTSFPSILRGAALTLIGTMAVVCAATIVLWEANFYDAREKYEHLKLAFFDDWQPRNWCPPGRETDNCRQVSEFVAALEGAENFNFFRSLPVEGTNLTVVTGVEYASALDVISDEPLHLWCYLTFGQGLVTQRITLAQKSAGSPPTYNDVNSFAPGDEEALPLSASRLSDLAQSHCQFSEFDRPNP